MCSAPLSNIVRALYKYVTVIVIDCDDDDDNIGCAANWDDDDNESNGDKLITYRSDGRR